MDLIQKNLLEQVAGLHEIPEGAYNIRSNGEKLARNTTANIDIVSKTDKDGIDIIIKPGTVNESVHIPVLLSRSGFQDMVYNDFYIGEDADVVIVDEMSMVDLFLMRSLLRALRPGARRFSSRSPYLSSPSSGWPKSSMWARS